MQLRFQNIYYQCSFTSLLNCTNASFRIKGNSPRIACEEEKLFATSNFQSLTLDHIFVTKFVDLVELYLQSLLILWSCSLWKIELHSSRKRPLSSREISLSGVKGRCTSLPLTFKYLRQIICTKVFTRSSRPGADPWSGAML